MKDASKHGPRGGSRYGKAPHLPTKLDNLPGRMQKSDDPSSFKSGSSAGQSKEGLKRASDGSHPAGKGPGRGSKST